MHQQNIISVQLKTDFRECFFVGSHTNPSIKFGVSGWSGLGVGFPVLAKLTQRFTSFSPVFLSLLVTGPILMGFDSVKNFNCLKSFATLMRWIELYNWVLNMNNTFRCIGFSSDTPVFATAFMGQGLLIAGQDAVS